MAANAPEEASVLRALPLRMPVKGQEESTAGKTAPPTPASQPRGPGSGSGALSTDNSAADLGLLSCGLFEDELEELMSAHSPKATDSAQQLS